MLPETKSPGAPARAAGADRENICQSVPYRQALAAASHRPDIAVLSIRPIDNAGNLRAFVKVCVGPFIISDCRIIQQPNQRPWVSLPQSRGTDGRWWPVVEITDRALKADLQDAVLAAWEDKHRTFSN